MESGEPCCRVRMTVRVRSRLQSELGGQSFDANGNCQYAHVPRGAARRKPTAVTGFLPTGLGSPDRLVPVLETTHRPNPTISCCPHNTRSGCDHEMFRPSGCRHCTGAKTNGPRIADARPAQV